MIVASFLRNVEAGTIRLVSWLAGGTVIYRGPGKSKEIPLLTTGTTISSKVINVDLDITDQTADLDENGTPQPIKVRVLASAIVSVGDTRPADQDGGEPLLRQAGSRSGEHAHRSALELRPSRHQPAHARPALLREAAPSRVLPALAHRRPCASSRRRTPRALVASDGTDTLEDDDDPLAVIIRKACSRELTDLGLIFNSLNIKVVQSEVADARRRMSAAEAQATADIVAGAAGAPREGGDSSRPSATSRTSSASSSRRRPANAALIAQAEAKRQEAMGVQRVAELDATQIAQARADAERVTIEAQAAAEAEAIRIRTVAAAKAESIEKVNKAIAAGGESYFRYRQIEMLPQIAPEIADGAGGGEADHDLGRRERRRRQRRRRTRSRA